MPLPDPGTWPAGVEWKPRRQSFGESPHAAVRAIRMEAGNTAREALDADEVVRVQVLWRFTPAEWSDTMRQFFIDVRATGWDGNWVDAGGATRTGLICVDGEAPRGAPRGRFVEVTATLEIIPDEGA
jgi:hypothetical protein